MATFISSLVLAFIAIPLGYMLLLMVASFRKHPELKLNQKQKPHRFMIAIPAHDEATVIAATVERLLVLDYPPDLYSVHVVADYCSDDTAEAARQAGANVHERYEGPRAGKGAALTWLFARVFRSIACDAVVIFDADTQVDRQFLRIMADRLSTGEKVIQGKHVISNSQDGWFPSLTAAMFIVDNRYQNLGRSNLGWSAKNMGDSICLQAEVLQRTGWGKGLTEDYQLRQRLLLEGIKIYYEPTAIGYGEAALSWAQARKQRERWLRGTIDSSHRFRWRMLWEGFRRRDLAVLDGGLQALLPSYSTLTLFSGFMLALQIAINWLVGPLVSPLVILLWVACLILLFLYPFIGLLMERAPARLYLAMLSGFFYIIWRTFLSFTVRLGKRQVIWKRTPHGQKRRAS